MVGGWSRALISPLLSLGHPPPTLSARPYWTLAAVVRLTPRAGSHLTAFTGRLARLTEFFNPGTGKIDIFLIFLLLARQSRDSQNWEYEIEPFIIVFKPLCYSFLAKKSLHPS